ncbi:MAG: leucyl aminopeptidase family protein [Pseudomonadales bacterium]|nr:leucyl aminopeptidase family protein [Pseudomonadales bacterium]
MNQLSDVFLETRSADSTPVILLQTEQLDDWQDELPAEQKAWLNRQSFKARPGEFAWVELDNAPHVVSGWDGKANLATLGHLAMSLPEGDYHLESELADIQILGWALGAYQFNRYKLPKREPARLAVGENIEVRYVADAIALGRDLINTPAEDMKPSHLEAEIAAMAETFDAVLSVTTGEELLDLGAGAIHAVGRAADDSPRLMDLTWGDPTHPKVTLVGKGVTFDSGGLDIKPAAGMRQMKKDMGGAATAIGLAYLIMATGISVRLRLLIPAAENAIAGNAFRPGDVLSTYKGLTVEIDNTDAEGRLLLCDALALASEDKPELIVDYATLTGAARVAVGTEIAAMFSSSDEVAEALTICGEASDDAVWRMPLHSGYNYMMESKVADMVNSAASGFAGSITAALFLQRFVSDADWIHFDIMAFNLRSRAGRPEGGEPMGLRAVYQYLADRYGSG